MAAEMDRRTFVGGGLAVAMAALFGMTIPEAEANIKAAEKEPEKALRFIIDGTMYAPEIQVVGIIRAMSMEQNTDYHDVISDGMLYQRIPFDPKFTFSIGGPFTIEFVDEQKFWGR